MPRAHTCTHRLVSVARLFACALLFAACSDGGGGGGGPVLGTTTAPAGTSSVTLAWEEAEGPVEGYEVYVQRASGPFEQEEDVSGPEVTVTGTPGTTARVVVVAFDSEDKKGPSSPPSPRFTFPDPSAQAEAASAPATAAAASYAVAGAGVETIARARPADAGDDADADERPDASHLAGGLVWQAGDALRVTNAHLETTQLFSRPAPDARLAAVGDFDGDGFGDLLWVDETGGLAFTPTASLAEDPVETPVFAFGLLEADERVAGAGDFDGDGVGDLLIRRADDTVHLWFTMPGDVVEMVEVGSARGSTLIGVGDFDGNGSDDLAWTAGGGLLVLWLVDGMGARDSVEVAFGAEIEITGTGDFDGNGAAEVAVRDVHGDVFVVHPLRDSAAFEATDLADAQAWKSVGSTDLDRDGTDDLVLLGEGALRTAYLPGDAVLPLDPASPWSLIALLP